MRKNYFWGLLLIIIGLAYIGRRVFDFDIGIGTIILSFVLIYWGISMLTGKSSAKVYYDKEDSIFSNSEIKANTSQDKYDVIFSNSTIDLTTLPVPVDKRVIKIDTVFARSVIRVNPGIPAVIKVSSVFASAHLPNNTRISFGDYTYATQSYRDGFPHLYIKADVIFGDMEVVEF